MKYTSTFQEKIDKMNKPFWTNDEWHELDSIIKKLADNVLAMKVLMQEDKEKAMYTIDRLVRNKFARKEE